MIKNWKDITGYKGIYQVSDSGDVKSCARVITKKLGFAKIKERRMKLATTKDGYLTTTLSHKGKLKSFLVHRLVAKAFLKRTRNKNEVNHKNFNKKDNHVSNLEWVSHAENLKHCTDNGLEPFGNSKRHRYITFNGETKTHSEWGRSLGISVQLISYRLKAGKTLEKILTTVQS